MKENSNMDSNVVVKTNKGVVVLLVILTILVLGLISNVVYEKIKISDDNNIIDKDNPTIDEDKEQKKVSIPDNYLPITAKISKYYKGKSNSLVYKAQNKNENDEYEEVEFILFDNNEFYIKDNNEFVPYGYIGYYIENDTYFEVHCLYQTGSDASVKKIEERIKLLYKSDSNSVSYPSTAGLNEDIKLVITTNYDSDSIKNTLNSLILVE